MIEHLERFFAVTATSLYVAISSDGRETGRPPVLEKLALREGATSKVKVGAKYAGWDEPFFRIRKGFFQLCCGWEDSHHEAYTPTKVVALFLNEDEARECLKIQDSCPLDPRWHKQTLEALRAIGHDHPTFRVCWDDFPDEYLKSEED